MKVLIIYFSGTGNTKVLAQGYKTIFEKRGHEVSILSIEEGTNLPEHDILVVGGPIYAGNMPDELINWVRKNIKKVTAPKQAIVYSSSAGLLNANGVKSIGKKLINKGYTLIDSTTFEMPRNFYIDKYEPTPEALQKQHFESAVEKLIQSVNKVNRHKDVAKDETNSNTNFNTKPNANSNTQDNMTTETVGIEIKESVMMIDFFADLFRMMAKSMGKSFQINEKCIGCGVCEKNCPKENIDFKEKKYYNQCMLCTRCIHNCPVNAISYKGKTIEQYRVHYTLKI